MKLALAELDRKEAALYHEINVLEFKKKFAKLTLQTIKDKVTCLEKYVEYTPNIESGLLDVTNKYLDTSKDFRIWDPCLLDMMIVFATRAAQTAKNDE